MGSLRNAPMQRHTALTVFGILNIVFAALGVFGIIGTITMLSMQKGFTHNPVLKIMHSNPAYMSWIKINIPLGLIAGAALLTAGIGLLKIKKWARKLSIGYGIYAILLGLTNIFINVTYVFLPMFNLMAQQRSPEAIGGLIGAVGGGMGSVFGLIYPILLLIFMTRPKIAAAFHAPVIPPFPEHSFGA